MTLESQVLIAFLLYLALFGWIGHRRGTTAELTVLVVTVVSWVLLQERGDILVRIANFAGKFLNLVTSGGLSGGTEDAVQAVADAPAIVTEDNTSGFLFLVWATTVLLTYVLTSNLKPFKGGKHNAVAWFLGIANGFVFASLLLPVLANLVEKSSGQISEAPLQNLVNLVTRTFEFLAASVAKFWAWVTPLSTVTWLVLITLVLVLTALTLRRGGAKAKS